MTTALLPSPDNGPDAGAAENGTSTDITAALRFRVRAQGSVVKGRTAYIVVAVDGDRISRISAHPTSSEQLATGAAELLNRANPSEASIDPGADTADQTASEDARSAVLTRVERECPPLIRPVSPPAEPLTWRPGVASTRTAADDAVNTYIVERHSSTSWELCAWNSTTFDDVVGLAGVMTPTRGLARAIAAEYCALGERYRAAEHSGTSRATAAILAAYHHERARHAAAPPVRVTAA